MEANDGKAVDDGTETDAMYRKLEKAVRLVVNNQLSENCDDTLVEKLVSFLGEDSLQSKVNKEQLFSILSIVNEALTAFANGDGDIGIDVSSSLRLMGALLRHEHVFVAETDVVKSCLEMIANFLSRISDEQCTNYSLQAAYLNALHNIASHESGNRHLLVKRGKNSFPLSLFAMTKTSESHFVRNASEKVLLTIVNASAALAFEGTQIDALFTRLIEHLFTSLNFLKSLLNNENVCKHLEAHHNLSETLLSKFNEAIDTSYFCVYCSCLGKLLSDSQLIQTVYRNIAINGGNCKGLLHFSTELVQRDKNYMKEWCLYCINPLITNSELIAELTNEFHFSTRELQFVFGFLKKELVNCSLFLLSESLDSRRFSEKQLRIVMRAVSDFVCENIGKKQMKKQLSEAISILCRLPTSGMHEANGLQEKQQFVKCQIEQCLQTFCTASQKCQQSLKCELLKGIRTQLELLEEQCLGECSSIEKISCLIHDILNNEDIINRVDECDSALEVLCKLSILDENLFVSTYPDLIQSFANVWNVCVRNPGYSSLTALCIPIAFNLNFVLSSTQLNVLQMRKHVDIIRVLTNYLESNDISLRGAVIDALSHRSSIPRSLYLSRIDKQMFFQNIAKSVFKIAMFDVDFELQLKALKLLSLFVEAIVANITGDELLQFAKHLYENGFFDALYHTFNNNCVTFNLKKEAFRLKVFVTNQLLPEIGSEQFRTLLSECSPPKIVHKSVANDREHSKSDVNREEVLNQIFGDGFVPPTQILLEELFCRHEDENRDESIADNWEPVAVPTLLRFLSECETLSFEQPVFCILDDIIFAANIRNETSVDCY